ncbi:MULTISPECIES: RtcB family protein [Thiorhodovibrio]|uniref:RtcB family protein n=1 Tax=Thiorhodovibrio TaxID=61593 RepID=UPI0019144326|nr:MULTISPECIES: RtcB family protein [Thiorhodovibrio]WPL12836.1 RNA-splicing ligase RtcB [Thiorhodovibrio litoralis]
MPIRQVFTEGEKPVKVWTDDIDLRSQAQLINISRLLFIHKHVAAMPDVHLGIGATIGSVIATGKAIIPVWVTRKGAIRAREGDFGIIPGSMGAKSYIVRGKGNPESFCSCAHGAGRRMSRTAAEKQFKPADLEAQTQGVVCRKCTSAIKGHGRHIVDVVVGAVPEDWVPMVLMDWSGGFWGQMAEEYPRLLIA